MALPYMKVGQYFGTTAAQSVSVGFRPTAIFATPQVSTGGRIYWWSEEDLANVFVTDGAASGAVSAAISLHDHGFSLPASNTTVNNNATHYQYWAWRGTT